MNSAKTMWSVPDANISRELVEFGPVNKSIHAIDEHVRLADIAPLTAIYEQAIANLLQ